ncbi:MAG: galactokinase, partial [Planctomycetota bacterium]
MIDRENAILLEFKERYGTGEGVGLARAPGRVNLIGEHTDYNDGLVLPIAIARDTVAGFRPNDSRTVRVHSMTLDESADFSLDDEAVATEPPWLAYVAGVARSLMDAEVELVGCDLVIHSTVPAGGGLSSSAALEVSTALALCAAAGQEVDRKELMWACHRAEGDYVGMRCGIMDQYVALFGEAGSAVLLDCRAAEHQLVPCATDVVKFVVCDTGVRHELATSEYNRRRQECEEGARDAARLLKAKTVRSLRDLDPGDLSELGQELEPVIFRRVRHVVTENARVREAAGALREQNYLSMGVLMDASHDSLRDDYEVSCSELDTMVELAWSQRGVYGSRMTGGGFGGCTITLVDA